MDYLATATASFDFNAWINRLHITTDGICFPDRQDAKIHARTLTDATIKVYERQGTSIVEATAKSTAETIEANTPLDPVKNYLERVYEDRTGSGAADLLGQQNATDNLELQIQNAKTVDEVNALIVGQTGADVLAVAHARVLFLQSN